jgi:hypothetical protein
MEIARRRAEARAREREPSNWGVGESALELTANLDVETTRDLSGRVARARRQDLFDMMRARGRLGDAAVNAVRRLQNDMVSLHRGVSAGGNYLPRVDQSRTPGDFSDARLRAGARLDAVLSLVGPVNARLLTALCELEVVLGRSPDWRMIVERDTGETLADAQGAAVRLACDNLAAAYLALDRNPRRDETKPPAAVLGSAVYLGRQHDR